MTWRDKEIQRQIAKLKTNNIYIFVKHLIFARFQCQLYIACCKHIYNYIDGYNKSALIAVSTNTSTYLPSQFTLYIR